MAPKTETWAGEAASMSTFEHSPVDPSRVKDCAPCKKKTTGKKQGGGASKKPKTKGYEGPTRPLSAYNYFFQEERVLLLEKLPVRAEGKPRRSHGKIGFADMARLIGGRWKALSPEKRQVYQSRAAKDRERYDREMKAYKLEKKTQTHEQIAQAGSSAQLELELQDYAMDPTSRPPVESSANNIGSGMIPYYQQGPGVAFSRQEMHSSLAPVDAFAEPPPAHYDAQPLDYRSFDIEPFNYRAPTVVSPSLVDVASRLTRAELESFVAAFR